MGRRTRDFDRQKQMISIERSLTERIDLVIKKYLKGGLYDISEYGIFCWFLERAV